jgi:tRNA(Ile)-lysidine synthase
MQVLERVREFIGQHDLIGRDARVLAAVSGGSDSVALAHLLHDLDAAGELHLIGLVHFNHQLRASAAADERFAAAVAESLGRSILVDRADVAARARRERRSIEDAARAARYEFFERARLSSNADVVALGHTRDDQAETFLLRLVRGAGARGLAGMHPRNGSIVRPLLGCRRQDLRDWLGTRTVPFVEDESNSDVSIPRNRVRAELLPLLEARFNPGIADVLADEAEIAREAWEWMDAAAADLAATLVRSSSGPRGELVREIDIARLSAAPLALRRAVLWRTISDVAGRRPVAFGHVEAAIRLISRASRADARDGDGIDLPGQRLQRIGPRLVLRGRRPGTIGRPAAEPQEATNVFRYPLSIPGEVVVPEAGWRVSVEPLGAGGELATASATMCSDGENNVAFVRGDLGHGSLAVRNRRPGDRFRPVGLCGRKKLQDFFVDLKIARGQRDSIPLVVDERDRIVWVAGYGIDEVFRVTESAQAVLILKLKALGGSA